MFGLFKKDPDRDFEFHKDRTKKLLKDSLTKFIRVDEYVCGLGHGSKEIQLIAAHGALAKAQSSLKEAIYNAEQAVKYCNKRSDKIIQLKESINSVFGMTGTQLFVKEIVVKTWDDSRKQWLLEFENLI
ncbi:hypothetical protein HGB07_00900 [Candidatus Roizmanbacteria bacterium]|nr:hypothetical protein [Candidatus Roizmanbacteria bacterium]